MTHYLTAYYGNQIRIPTFRLHSSEVELKKYLIKEMNKLREYSLEKLKEHPDNSYYIGLADDLFDEEIEELKTILSKEFDKDLKGL